MRWVALYDHLVMVSPVVIFPDMVKNEPDNKRVKINTTLPAWLKEAAEQGLF